MFYVSSRADLAERAPRVHCMYHVLLCFRREAVGAA
jgi:hypothetical protein